MNLRQLEYFVRVVELGSFSKAAQVLDIAQPALSRQVRLLETDLRLTLLHRHGRGVGVTEAGQRLFDHGIAILDRVARAEDDMGATRDEPVGRIVVGLPPTLGRLLTLPLIEGFTARLPKARLAIVEGLSGHIVEWLTSGRVDLGVLYNPEAQSAIEIVPVLEETLHLVERRDATATPGHGAGEGARADAAGPALAPHRRAGAPLPLRELSTCRLIVPERLHAMRRLLETRAAHAGVRLDIAWEVSSVPSIIDMVCAGHGCAVLTASAAQASGRGAELAVRPIVEPAVTSVICLATSSSRLATPLLRHAAALLTDLVRGLAPDGASSTERPPS